MGGGGARFRILGGGGGGGGGKGGPNSQQAHDVLTSMRRNDVASTSFRRHVPTRFLINQCQIITFCILKSGNIENSRIELKRIVLQVPSNQIKVTFIIILPFNLVHLWFFSSPEHEVLMVSYCDQSLSVVRALSTFCFNRLLLRNSLTDFGIILQEGSLGDPPPKLLKPFRSVEQNGRQSQKIEKPLNNFFS